MNSYQKEYIFRINKVVDYINDHLEEELNLEKLAKIANFSPFHFHRIFSAFVGESLYGYIKRIRIEKSASLLLNQPDISVSEIAMYCGYNSFSVFCRNFRERYHMSAKEFRKIYSDEKSKIDQIKSKSGKLTKTSMGYVWANYSSQKWRSIMKNDFEIKEMPVMKAIYVRHTGEFYQIGNAYEKLFRWAGPRGLLNFPETKTLTLYHDDPKVTDMEKVRQSACLIVNKDVKVEGEVGKLDIKAGKYVVGHFEISPDEFTKAWDATCLWLSESGFQPEDGSPYELYHNNHEEHPEKKFIVDICIPVKSL